MQAKTDILKRSPDALTSDSTGLPVLIVNDAGVSKSISLGNSIYLDLDSNLVQESIVINPYSSKVLIHTGNYLSYTSSKQYIRSSDICRLTGNLTFSPQFTYTISARSSVSLTIYDNRGRQIAVLIKGVHAPGVYHKGWNGSIPAGLYTYVFKTDSGKTLKIHNGTVTILK